MTCPTAEAIISSQIVQEVRLPTPFGQAATQIGIPTDPPLVGLVAQVPAAEVLGPAASPAAWLQIVERRIQNSLQPVGRDHENEGQWLTAETASAATAFFQLASDVLPGEPHIYSSRGGDLVAEFKAAHGEMSAIISTKAFTALAVVDGTPEQTRIEWNEVSRRSVRATLKALTEKLRDGEHGSAVAT